MSVSPQKLTSDAIEFKETDNPAMKTKAMQKMLDIAERLNKVSPTLFNEKNSFLLDYIGHKKTKNPQSASLQGLPQAKQSSQDQGLSASVDKAKAFRITTGPRA